MNRFASRWNFWTRNNSKQHRRWRGKTNNDKGRAKRVPPRVLYDSVFKCLSNYLQCTCEHSLIYKSKESIAHSDLAEKPTISHNLFKPQVSNYSISQQARIVRQVHLPSYRYLRYPTSKPDYSFAPCSSIAFIISLFYLMKRSIEEKKETSEMEPHKSVFQHKDTLMELLRHHWDYKNASNVRTTTAVNSHSSSHMTCFRRPW